MFAINRKESSSQPQVVNIVASAETDLKKVLYDVASKKGELVKNKNGTPYFVPHTDEKLNVLQECKSVIVTPEVVGTIWNTPEDVKTETVAEWSIVELPVTMVQEALSSLQELENAKQEAEFLAKEAERDQALVAEIKNVYSEIKVYDDFFTKPDLLRAINANLSRLSEAGLTRVLQFAISNVGNIGMNNLAACAYQLMGEKDTVSLPFYLAATSTGDFIAMANLYNLHANSDAVLKAYWAQRMQMANLAYFNSLYRINKPWPQTFTEAQNYAVQYYGKLGMVFLQVPAPVVAPVAVAPAVVPTPPAAARAPESIWFRTITPLESGSIPRAMAPIATAAFVMPTAAAPTETKGESKRVVDAPLATPVSPDVEHLNVIKNAYAEVKTYSDFHSKPQVLRTVNGAIKQLSSAGIQSLNGWARRGGAVGMLNLIGYTEQLLNHKDMALPFYLSAAKEGDIVAMANLQLLHRAEGNTSLQAYWIQRVQNANPEYFATIYRSNPFTTSVLANLEYATAYYTGLGFLSAL